MAPEAIEQAQARLHESRVELRALLDGQEEAGEHFPRSATMRFLAGSGAQAVLMGVAPRLFRLLRFAPLARSLFSRH